MNYQYIPTFRIQRGIYAIPRGPARFQAYLRAMVEARTGDLRLPLSAMNPMAREHVPAYLDRLLEQDADGTAAQALKAEVAGWRGGTTEFNVTLVVADDLKGQWTNRVTTEFSHRFEPQALPKRSWVAGILWSSEEPALATVAEEIRLIVHRAEYFHRHGPAKTLREMLAQEGEVMACARCRGPTFKAEEIAMTRAVLAPHLDSEDRATVLTGLFGDTAVDSLGYPAMGLAERAGLALALHDAAAHARGGRR